MPSLPPALLCTECEAVTASCVCSCEDAFCTACWTRLHRGAKAQHQWTPAQQPAGVVGDAQWPPPSFALEELPDNAVAGVIRGRRVSVVAPNGRRRASMSTWQVEEREAQGAAPVSLADIGTYVRRASIVQMEQGQHEHNNNRRGSIAAGGAGGGDGDHHHPVVPSLGGVRIGGGRILSDAEALAAAVSRASAEGNPTAREVVGDALLASAEASAAAKGLTVGDWRG
jgi:hypothetical protein